MAARAQRDPLPLRPAAGDAARHLGHQPDADPDRALVFGAQNVPVANPSWLSGGVELLHGRRAALQPHRHHRCSSVVVVAFVWFVLTRTRSALQCAPSRRTARMAALHRHPHRARRHVDLRARLGHRGPRRRRASQIGNVGPELGQSYIVDSFMVVVLGGVGQLAGTRVAALGLGIVNKLLEPVAGRGARARSWCSCFIIVFIQKRPQGLFALKGRAAET